MARVTDVFNTRDDVTFFDESANPNNFKSVSNAVNTGSIDTSTFDDYRFGVEITCGIRNTGIAKVLSGDGDIRIHQTSFGQSFNYRGSQTFVDRTENPTQFLLETNTNLPTVLDSAAFPVFTAIQIQSRPHFDGAIDALNIIVDPSDVDSQKPVPFYAEGVRGEVGGSSPDPYKATTLMANFYINDQRSYAPAFLDGEITSIPNIPKPLGAINMNRSVIAPFIDRDVIREFDSLSYDGDLKGAILQLKPSIIESTIESTVYSTGGFVYDNSTRGIDSIAFGGQTY